MRWPVGSLRAQLLSFAVAMVVLSTGAFALLLSEAQENLLRQGQRSRQETAHALAMAVDGELQKAIGILSTLRASEAMRTGDWAEVDRQGRTVLAHPNAWLVVQDRAGQQLVNTRLSAGSPLLNAQPPAAMWAELAEQSARVCNVTSGILEQHLTCVDMLARTTSQDVVVSIMMAPRYFESLLQRSDGTQLASLLDRAGRVIWRNIQPTRFVGKPATEGMRRAIAGAKRGQTVTWTLDGVRSEATFERSELSGWTVVIGTPVGEASHALNQAWRRGSFIAFSLLVLSSLFAFVIATRLLSAINALRSMARQQASTPAKIDPTGFSEVDDVAAELARAFDRQARSEERYRRIFEQTSDLVLTADLDQVITDCNPAAADAVGVAREEAVGQKISDFVRPEDYAQSSEMLTHKLRAGGTTRYDVRVKTKAGDWLSWEINSGLTYDESGKPTGLHVVGRDVTERKRWEAHQNILIGELNHRVKNTLSVVQSLSHQTFHQDRPPSEAIAAFEHRLQALASAHNLLSAENWESASLTDLVERTLSPFNLERFDIDGEPTRVSPKIAVNLVLALHELATNATKYGSLSTDNGRVRLQWQSEGPAFSLSWAEYGGPTVEPPIRTGFGTRMIRRVLASELGGDVSLEFEPKGLVCRIVTTTDIG